jgi:hypothetical protein
MSEWARVTKAAQHLRLRNRSLASNGTIRLAGAPLESNQKLGVYGAPIPNISSKIAARAGANRISYP